MANYDFDDGGDFDNDPNLKMEPPCKVRCELDGVFVSNSDYGQSLGVSIKNAELVDGILARQFKDSNGDPAKPNDGGEPVDGSFKVLAWASEQSVKILEEGATETVMDEPYLMRNYVGNNYFFEPVEARMEGAEDDDYESEPEEPIPLEGYTMFFGSTQNGPKSTSKTLAKILTEQGGEAVVDEDSQYEWLCDDPALRSDLMGKEVVLAMTQKTSDDSGHTFHHPYVLDGKTNAPIFVDNEVDDSDDEDETEEEDEAEDDDIPEDVASFFDTCNELNITNEQAVEGLLDDMVSDGDIDSEQVEEFGGEEAVIQEVAQ